MKKLLTQTTLVLMAYFAYAQDVTNAVFDGLEYASATAASVRLDQRTSFGGRWARGVVMRTSPDGSSCTPWDTTAEENGWQALSSGGATAEVAVQNNANLTMEGGRLAADTTWTSNTVHVVRNWVSVPSGVTLTIDPYAIVKFTENSGIIVEDGGTLDTRSNCTLTQTMDDSVGGNADLRALVNRRQGAIIHVQPGGTHRDLGLMETRYVDVDTFGSISVNVAQCLEQEGRVFAQFTFTGVRPETFSCNYTTEDGTAIAVDDYTAKSGAVSWSSTDEGAKWVEIPVTADAVRENDETFTLKITAVRGMNIATDEATIKIVDGNVRITGSDIAEVATSEAVRIDLRTGTGGRLAHGIEKTASPDGLSCSAWDTTLSADGWHPLTSGTESVNVLVRNDAGIAIEEGRLVEDAIWSNDTVHVVRNWVTVPNGVTLTVAEGTEVKFTEDTGIRVEDGGRLVANGAATNHIVFTVMADDATAGGDTDMVAATAARNGANVYAQSSAATITENGYLETRYMNVNTYGSVSVENAKILEQTGMAYVPITLNTSRSGLFEVDWIAVDGTATMGEDYTRASGTISWVGAGEGTKFIEIPVTEDALAEGSETFTVKLVAGRGVNLSGETATVSIVDSLLTQNGADIAAANADAVRLDQRTTFGGRLAHGVEKTASSDGTSCTEWDTTQESDGLVTVTDGTESCELAVLNGEGLAVEEGRLTENKIWSNDVVRVVRNWVVVPNGVTLTVAEGAIVKFTEDTGIKVEDGGRLEVVGTAEKRVVFTHAEDDTAGGDTDFAEKEANWQDVAIVTQSGAATFTENGHLETRYMNVSGYGGVAIQDARAIEVVGATYIPVTVSGSRATAFSLDWVAVDGTATLSNDYALASGTLSWTGVGEGTKFIQIPLVLDSEYETNEWFNVKIVAVRGMNVTRETGTVSLVDSELMIEGDGIASASSDAVRIDMRTSFGGRLARGVENVGSNEGASCTVWDTTQLPDGWQTLQDDTNSIQVATLNGAGLRVEEGRLTGNATWSNDVLHVVRNWVVVPSGVTLTVTPGTIVKFTEDTGIKVEDGGVLNVTGEVTRHVVFAPVDDDTIGGDTDMTDGVATWCNAQIYKMASGTVTENSYLEVRKMKVSSWGSVALQAAQSAERNAMAYVPVTLSGSRSAAFSVDWEAVPGTAEFGGDYTLASGTLSWTGTGEGTKFIEIPLVSDNVPEAIETFTVRLRGACGMNVNGASAVVNIVDSRASLPCAPAVASAAAVRLDMRTSLGGRLAHGTEKVGVPDGSSRSTWVTTAEANGWQTLTSGGESADVLVQNSADVFIEEGRLVGNATWNSGKVHLVRNWVVVPNGVTLTVTEGTVVKFTEDTGIKIEDGGRLDVTGTLGNRVVFTMAEDDFTGGDTDMRNVAAAKQNVMIDKMASGTFTDNGYLETRLMTANAWGSVSVLAAQTHEGTERVYVPVTPNGSRTSAFSVYWRAIDGTARHGDDFTLASGRLEWSGVSEGMKYVEIPLVRDNVPEGVEHFTLELTGGCGMNIGTAAADVCVFDTAEFAHTFDGGTGRLEQRTNLVARLVRGTVPLPYSCAWQTNETETASLRITAERIDGEGGVTELLASNTPAEGVLAWDTTALADGWWRLTHSELDADGNVIEAWTADLDIQQNVIAHSAMVSTNETWEGHGMTHYLAEDFWVREGSSLTIEPGAMVKNELGATFNVETNAVLSAVGTAAEPVYFTSIRDDAHGGDVNSLDGEPQFNDWNGVRLFGDGATLAYAQRLYCGINGYVAVVPAGGQVTASALAWSPSLPPVGGGTDISVTVQPGADGISGNGPEVTGDLGGGGAFTLNALDIVDVAGTFGGDTLLFKSSSGARPTLSARNVGASVPTGALTLGNAVSIDNTLTVSVGTGKTLTLAGTVSPTGSSAAYGAQSLVKDGAGTLELAGGVSFTDKKNFVDVVGGTLSLGGSVTTERITTRNGGVLKVADASLSSNLATMQIATTNGTTGALDVSAGTLAIAGNVQIGLYGNGSVDQTGGLVTCSDYFAIARYIGSVGTYSIRGGRLSVNNLIIGEEGTGTLTVSGDGVVEVAGGLGFSGGGGWTGTGYGTLNLLTGGTLVAKKIELNDPMRPMAINFDGGTIRVPGEGVTYGNLMQGVKNVNIGANGMIFDTGSNAVSINQAFSGSVATGPIVKRGSGKLSIAGNGNMQGGIVVEEGTLALGPDYATASGEAATANNVPGLAYRWSFNGTLADSVGGSDAAFIGSSALAYTTDGKAVSLPGGSRGVGAINLGSNLFPTNGESVTVEIWAKQRTIRKWSRVFDFGDGTANYILLSWTQGTDINTDRMGIMGSAGWVADNTLSPFTRNQEFHISAVFVPNAFGDGRMMVRLAKREMNGRLSKSGILVTGSEYSFAELKQTYFYLGRSQFTADYDASADYDEVRFWNMALSDEQLAQNAILGPDVLPNVAATPVGAIASLAAAQGAAFNFGARDVEIGVVDGMGTIEGAGAVQVTGALDPAATGVGTLAVNVPLSVTGEWVVDVGGGAIDLVECGAALDISQCILRLRDPDLLRRESFIIATFPPGALSGHFASHNLGGTGYAVRYDQSSGTISLTPQWSGIIIR